MQTAPSRPLSRFSGASHEGDEHGGFASVPEAASSTSTPMSVVLTAGHSDTTAASNDNPLSAAVSKKVIAVGLMDAFYITCTNFVVVLVEFVFS